MSFTRRRASIAISATLAASVFLANSPVHAQVQRQPQVKTEAFGEVRLTYVKFDEESSGTEVGVAFQRRPSAIYDVHISDTTGQVISNAVTVRPSFKCDIARLCTTFVDDIVMPVGFEAGVLTIHRRGTSDMIGMQVWNPYTFKHLDLIQDSAPDGGNNLFFGTLNWCSDFDWPNWSTGPEDAREISKIFERKSLIAWMTVSVTSAVLTQSQWLEAGRGSTAVRVTAKVAREVLAEDIVDRLQEDRLGDPAALALMPTWDQIDALSTVLAVNRADSEGMCSRHGR